MYFLFFTRPGQFMSAFTNIENSNTSNPFNTNTVNWGNNMNGNPPPQHQQQPFANPFRDTTKMNGFSQNFQPIFPMPSMVGSVNGGTNGWTPNPFKVSAIHKCFHKDNFNVRRVYRLEPQPLATQTPTIRFYEI